MKPALQPTPHGATGRLVVPIPQHDVLLGLIATNTHGNSDIATTHIRWGARGQNISKPSLHVLAIGIGTYGQKGIPALRFPARDARRIAKVLSGQRDHLYDEVRVKVLSDQAATKAAILDGLHWLAEVAKQDDVAMIFLAGHSLKSAQGHFHFLPYGADPQLHDTSIQALELKRILRKIKGKVVLLIDTNHSIHLLSDMKADSRFDVAQAVNELSSPEIGVMVLASTTGRSVSPEKPGWGNGAFAQAIQEAFTGRGHVSKDWTLTATDLCAYVTNRVKELTGGKQLPTWTIPSTVPDFAIATMN